MDEFKNDKKFICPGPDLNSGPGSTFYISLVHFEKRFSVEFNFQIFPMAKARHIFKISSITNSKGFSASKCAVGIWIFSKGDQ